jgi:hypothetical protein
MIRPLFMITETDPYWRDLVLLYEYFHGDNGASHQTYWTALVALLSCYFGAQTDTLAVVEPHASLLSVTSPGRWRRSAGREGPRRSCNS